MTAIETIRKQKPHADAYVPKNMEDVRICLLADAILELADRLDRLEEKQPTATESPPEPFRIARPGRYKTRDGRFASITHDDGLDEGNWPWRGAIDEETYTWNTDGSEQQFDNPKPEDIVAGPLDDEPPNSSKTGGMRGFSPIEFTNHGSIVPAHSWSRDFNPHLTDCGRCNAWVDWSKVSSDAIVRPEHTHETLQDRIAVYLSDQAPLRSYSNAAADILAMVKVDSLDVAQ